MKINKINSQWKINNFKYFIQIKIKKQIMFLKIYNNNWKKNNHNSNNINLKNHLNKLLNKPIKFTLLINYNSNNKLNKIKKITINKKMKTKKMMVKMKIKMMIKMKIRMERKNRKMMNNKMEKNKNKKKRKMKRRMLMVMKKVKKKKMKMNNNKIININKQI